MLTGELPIGRFALPIRKIPGVDRRLDRIIESGLAKDPDDRYARASRMESDIDALLSTPGAPVNLDTLGHVAKRFTERVQQVMRRPAVSGEPRPPTAFDMRLDLLLTVLAVCGVLLSVLGIVLLVSGEDLRFAFVDIDHGSAGVLVLVYGVLLWNAAERARKYWPGARTMLLALTALASPTLVALPITIWTWVALLAPSTRIYYDARHRGLDAAEAATLAQGAPLPPADRPAVRERRRGAARANRTVALICGAIALAALIGWIIVASEGKAFKDEGAFFLGVDMVAFPLAAAFGILAHHVRHGRWLRFNGWLWSVLGAIAPRSGRRARQLARDARDGLA
jgi:hypothetical protein